MQCLKRTEIGAGTQDFRVQYCLFSPGGYQAGEKHRSVPAQFMLCPHRESLCPEDLYVLISLGDEDR